MTIATPLGITREGPLLALTLNRPEVRNALNPALIDALTHAVREAPVDVRIITLQGSGQSFCAGADLAWMRSSAQQSPAQNHQDAERLGALFAALSQAPQLIVTAAHGAVRGGGGGLLAVSDVVVAAHNTTCAFSEVGLGLVPAVIAPHVVAKIGMGHARHLCATGDVMDAAHALRVGLVHYVVPHSALAARMAALTTAWLRNGPQAVATTKALLTTLSHLPAEQKTAHCVATIAEVRQGAEAQEGCAAFFARRRPAWMEL
jgi:methylglutaconyl-CoA hydratase